MNKILKISIALLVYTINLKEIMSYLDTYENNRFARVKVKVEVEVNNH